MSAALKLAETQADDDSRLAALDRYDIMDTPREAAFDRIATLIRLVFGVETSLVTMIDAHRQWYKAAQGTPNTEVPVRDTFCQYSILGHEPMIVPDASLDDRFRDNPHVTANNGVRFYASMPLTTPDGENIGTICAIDSKPREFSGHEVVIFKELARVAMSELELRRLATTDGAPLIGRLTPSNLIVIAGAGSVGAFLAPPLARLLAGVPSDEEQAWFAAHDPARTDRAPVADIVEAYL